MRWLRLPTFSWLALFSLAVAAPGLSRAQEAEGPPVPDEPASDAAAGEAGGADGKASLEARARAHFRMGVGFYRERNYSAALIEFQRAYELVPHYKLMFNLGQTLVELQDYARAVEHLREYLERGGDEITAERRREVEQMIAQQEARLGEVVVTSDQEGAEVYVDERAVGTTPLDQPLRLGAGRRHVKLVKPGYVDAEQTIDLAAGDTLELEIRMRALADEAPASAEPYAHEYPSAAPTSNTGAWVAGITTLVLGAGAATMAVLTASAESELADERERETSRERLEELSDDVALKALITDIALGATLVSAVVTTVFLVSSDDVEEPDVGARLELRPGTAALRIDGRF